MDRRSQSLSFSLQPEVVAKLNSPGYVSPPFQYRLCFAHRRFPSSKYQLRLYCTSSSFYSPPGPFRNPLAQLCPIEFPPTCEVRVNGAQLTANLKGLKKKPGTAPPPDLGKATRVAYNQTNRVEMIYVNSQQPTSPKVALSPHTRIFPWLTFAAEVLPSRDVGRSHQCGSAHRSIAKGQVQVEG